VSVNRKSAFNDAATIKRHVIGTVQSNHATLLSSRYMSSQPTSESGIDRIWEMRTQKWMKCNVPPMRQADVFGVGSGTLFGKMEISKRMRDGKAVIFSYRPFLRTARLAGEPFPFGLSMLLIRPPRRLGPSGKYGGDRRPRAASQSKGKLAESEGDSSGDRVIG